MIEQLTPHNIWSQWNLEPGLFVPLSFAFVLYSFGIARAIDSMRVARTSGFRQWLVFVSGCAALALAMASPLDTLASQLLSAHMVQHVLLVLVAPPLLVASSLPIRLISLVPRPVEQGLRRAWSSHPEWGRLWSAADQPLVVGLGYATVLWLWHFPPLYQLTGQNEVLHTLEHLMLFGAGTAFWRSLLCYAPTRRGRAAFGAGIVSAFAMALQTGMLGGFLAFASRPWYATYASSASAWGVTPLYDQQLAGLILWIPAGLVYVISATALFVVWLNTVERELWEREHQIELGYDSPSAK